MCVCVCLMKDGIIQGGKITHREFIKNGYIHIFIHIHTYICMYVSIERTYIYINIATLTTTLILIHLPFLCVALL